MGAVGGKRTPAEPPSRLKLLKKELETAANLLTPRARVSLKFPFARCVCIAVEFIGSVCVVVLDIFLLESMFWIGWCRVALC